VVYFCADDYGLNDISSMHIQQCIDEGVLNKVSVFPNFGKVDLHRIKNKKNIRISLHLNLVEGKCLAEPKDIGLLADEDGNLKHAFGGLLKLNILQGKKLEEQLYKEIKAQVLFWKSILPQDEPFCIDSHQHTCMIPAVFRALLKVLSDEKIAVHHIRIPVEPLRPFIKTPSLYFTYSPINLTKQWLLKFLWQMNKKQAKKHHLPTSRFLGILFSGKMDEKRVNKILSRYMKMSEKDGRDIEVLFHPGYLEQQDPDFEEKNVVFKEFYLSENRKTEFDSVMKISERSVL